MTLEFNYLSPNYYTTRPRGTTLYFHGSDTRKLWENNLKDPDNYKFFEENGWSDEHAISYTFNTHGFRCEEFDFRESWLALGCSFTEGIGLAIDDVWPSILATHLNKHIWNLGIGGSSLDTCFRNLDYYIDKLNIQGVFLLQPPHHRFELFFNKVLKIYVPNDQGPHNSIFKIWYSDQNNAKFNAQKNILAMDKMCSDRNIRFITRPNIDVYHGTSVKRARDLMHNGKTEHIHLANLFYEDYKNGNS